MLGDRFKRELNKNDYYVVDPKTEREKSLDTDKLVDMAKKALKKAAIVGLIAGSLGTGALGYLFADEVADYKEERAYTKAVITVNKEYKDTHDTIEKGSISALIEEQGCCYRAYPDKTLEFILDNFRSPITKKCDDPECTTCERNREIESEINEIVKADARFTEAVEEHEQNQEIKSVRGK